MCDVCLGIYGEKQIDGSMVCPVCGSVNVEADDTETK